MTNESASCGAIANLLAQVGGISEIYYGGLIVYSQKCKNQFLKIPNALIDQYGTISKQCITKMLINARRKSKCEVIIAITGNAGPNTIEDKPNAYFEFGIMINNEIFLSNKEYKTCFERN